MVRGEAGAQRWYPHIVRLAGNRETQLRVMAAWVMGQDNKSQEFHDALRTLVKDPEPLVRWNAAVALARFGDAAGENELRAMLRPYPLVAPQAGRLSIRLKERDAVRRGSAAARIQADAAKSLDVFSPLSGQVEGWVAQDRATVAAGDPIVMLLPAEEQVWEALRALYLVGQAEDFEGVERFARGVPGMPERIRQQAALTADAIRLRAGR